MRLSNRERLVENETNKFTTIEEMLDVMLGGPALPTQKAFIYSDADSRAYMGAAGVAKTSTLVAAGLLRCLLIPGYKLAVCRYDYNDLLGTTVERFEEMLARLPPGILVDRDKSPPMKWYIRSIVGDGTKLSTITFMGLKEYKGSYEFHGALIDEADELEERVVAGMESRMRAPGYDKREVLLAFNPPDKTHWLYKACTGMDERDRKVQAPWMKLFLPQPKENQRNLPIDYYEKLAKKMPSDMVDRLVKGEWGTVLSGDPVFKEFGKIHMEPVVPWVKGRELLRFWDFGFRRPACLWGSFDDDAQLQIHRELLGDAEEVGPFVSKVLSITNREFPGASEVFDFGDPAARQRKDTGSTLAILLNRGIQLLHRTSQIDEGLRTIRMLMCHLINGKPALLVGENSCPFFTRGLRGGYHLDKSGQKPVKDGFYDHLIDAFRYGIINLYSADGTPMQSVVTPGSGRTTQLSYNSLPDSLEYDRNDDDVNDSHTYQEFLQNHMEREEER